MFVDKSRNNRKRRQKNARLIQNPYLPPPASKKKKIMYNVCPDKSLEAITIDKFKIVERGSLSRFTWLMGGGDDLRIGRNFKEDNVWGTFGFCNLEKEVILGLVT